MEIIRELCSFEGRLAGTDAERRAANRLAQRLRESGRKAEVEPIYVHPQYGLVHTVHCLLGFVGSLISISIAPLGFGLVLVAATSTYLDLNCRLYLVRSLLFRRASQNVVSPGSRPGARAPSSPRPGRASARESRSARPCRSGCSGSSSGRSRSSCPSSAPGWPASTRACSRSRSSCPR